MKRKSNDEFVADLRAVNPNVIALEAYQNSRTKILFRCLKCGHEWSTIPDTLMMGHGCPKCGRKLANYKTRKTNNDFLTELATILPSVIPCEEYKGAAKKIRCRCNVCGHEWLTKPNWLLSGHGCPICGHSSGGEKIRSNNDEFLVKLAAVNLHITPLESYVLSSEAIRCKCDVCGHEWKSTPNNLLRGTGCPKCNRIFQTSFPEQAVFYFLKQLFSDAINGYKLENNEIDIFIPSLKVGIEYDGRHWHKGKHAVEKEEKKYAVLHKNGIKLVRIKEELVSENELFCDEVFVYTVEKDGYRSLSSVIEKVCLYLGASVSVDVDSQIYNIQEQYFAHRKGKSLAFVCPDAIKDWYQEKNGNITPFMVQVGSTAKYWWKCHKCGYVWKTTPNSRIKNGVLHECPNCYGNVLKSNEQFLRELASVNNNVKPLEEYQGADKKILCRCNVCGYEWQVTPSKLLNNRGCPNCYLNSKIRSQEDFLLEAHRVNPDIEILSDYLGIRKPLLCRCKKCGYEYQTTPNQILNGKKCRKCCGTAKKTNDEFVCELSEKKNSIEAIDEYKGMHAKIKFRCKICGCIWEAKPSSILNNGTGCPKCYSNSKMRSQQDFVNEVRDVNPNVEVLSDYLGIKKPLKCRCKKCGYEYQTTPYEILHGGKCRKCCGLVKKTNVEFLNELAEKNENIEALDEYNGANTKIRFKCKVCGFIWKTAPAEILNKGSGCPKCFSKRKSPAVVCVETKQRFENGQLAAAWAGLKETSSIYRCCRGKQKQTGGYHWEYADKSE